MRDWRRVLQRFIGREVRRRRPPVTVLRGSSDPPSRLPSNYKGAAERLVDSSAFKTVGFRNRVPDFVGVDPVLAEFVRAFVRELERRQLPFFVHELLRSRERQNALFKQGVTKARFGQSSHNFGLGVDIVHYGRYWDLTPKEWAIVGVIGKEVARKRGVSVVWGGDWSFYDPAHWELADWKIRKDIPLAQRMESYALRGLDGVNVKKPLKPVL